jgi:hypothetical protein
MAPGRRVRAKNPHYTPEYYRARLRELEDAGPTGKDLADTTIRTMEFIEDKWKKCGISSLNLLSHSNKLLGIVSSQDKHLTAPSKHARHRTSRTFYIGS